MANYCVWSARTGSSTGTVAGSVPTASEWDNAYTSLSECLAAITEADGDVIFVAHDHAKSYGATTYVTVTLSSGCVKILSIDRTDTTTATLKAGALEQAGGVNFHLGLQGPMYVYGCTFQVDGATNVAYIYVNNLATAFGIAVYENCTFKINNSGSSSNIGVGSADLATNKLTTFINCKFNFGGATQKVNCGGASHIVNFIGCGLAGTAVTTILGVTGRGGAKLFLSGCNFSSATNLIGIVLDDPHSLLAWNCKVPSSITTGTHQGIGSGVYELHACSTSDSIIDYYYQDGTGVVQSNTSIYLTSGSSRTKQADGSLTSYSLQANPSTAVSKVFPLYTPWVTRFIDGIGSRTVSMKVAYDDATAFKNTECWLEVEYYKNTGDPLSNTEVSAPTAESGISRDILAAGSDLTNTSEAWTGTSGWANKKTHSLTKTVVINQQGYVRCRMAISKDVTVYVNQVIGVA